MTRYELMFLQDPKSWDEALTTTIQEVKNILSEAGATISKEDVWGEKKLAYKIKGSSTGHYTLLELELDGVHIKEISKKLNLEKNIWRYMFVNLES